MFVEVTTMRRPLLLAVVSLAVLALLPLAVATAASPSPSPAAPAASRTVTATGTALIPPDENPASVVAVQLQGAIDPKSADRTYDAYVAKLDRIRRAVIGAGVTEDKVTAARSSAEPNGAGGVVNFNSIFRYEVRGGAVAVAAAQAAFAAGASMVYGNMPTPAVGTRRPDSDALDRAIAEATANARDYASRAARGRTVADEVATTMTVKGQPDNAPTQWQVEVTITFEVR